MSLTQHPCECDGGGCFHFTGNYATKHCYVERIHGCDGINNYMRLCDECAAGKCGYMSMCESIIDGVVAKG